MNKDNNVVVSVAVVVAAVAGNHFACLHAIAFSFSAIVSISLPLPISHTPFSVHPCSFVFLLPCALDIYEKQENIY